MKAKLTPWFPASVKPVHVGVYLRRFSWNSADSGNYAYWNGAFWGMFVAGYESPDDAYRLKDSPTTYHNLQWRGLASDPSKAAK